MNGEPDVQTVFLLHEIENGLNPEINTSIYEKIWSQR